MLLPFVLTISLQHVNPKREELLESEKLYTYTHFLRSPVAQVIPIYVPRTRILFTYSTPSMHTTADVCEQHMFMREAQTRRFGPTPPTIRTALAQMRLLVAATFKHKSLFKTVDQTRSPRDLVPACSRCAPTQRGLRHTTTIDPANS